MVFDSLSKKLNKATKSTQGFIAKKWEERKERHSAAASDDGDRQPPEEHPKEHPELVRQREERNEFLRPIAEKLYETAATAASAVPDGNSDQGLPGPSPSLAPAAPSPAPAPETLSPNPGNPDNAAPPISPAPAGAASAASEMEQPLVYSPDSSHRAVLLVTTPIEFGNFELSKQSYRLLARHVGMTLNSICHWALCVIDRGFGISYCYDLMSDQISPKMLGKNVFRVNEVTSGFVRTWSSCYYVGETTKTHDEIRTLGEKHMQLNPRYNLLESNCQHLAEKLVRDLCDGKVVSQDRLDEQLALLSPKLALDAMVARVQAKLDEHGHGAEEMDEVKEYMTHMGNLWTRVKKHRYTWDEKDGEEEEVEDKKDEKEKEKEKAEPVG